MLVLRSTTSSPLYRKIFRFAKNRKRSAFLPFLPMATPLSFGLTDSIEEKAIKHVLNYLKKEEHKEARRCKKGKKGKKGEGADVISAEGKYIEVKGCLKKETNLRISQQALEKIGEAGKLKQGSFFIYFVYEMASAKPKLQIIDYETFKNHKMVEIKWIIQPSQFKKETDIIPLIKI